MKKLFVLVFSAAMVLSFGACKKDKGESAKTNEAQEVSAVSGSATFQVNSGVSKIMWEGYKPTGTHNGTINISQGNIDVKDGKVVGGKFTIDMNSINVLDLQGEQKGYLEGHLKGSAEDNRDDFFNVSKYPTATFEITKVVDLKGNANANCMVYGNLTLKDQTQNIGVQANVNIVDNSLTVKTPKFNIDRTKWNVQYGSKSIFDNLGDKFINDEIGLQVDLMATK